MEDLFNLFHGFAVIFSWYNLGMMAIGLVLGVIIGVLPGLGGPACSRLNHPRPPQVPAVCTNLFLSLPHDPAKINLATLTFKGVATFVIMSRQPFRAQSFK